MKRSADIRTLQALRAAACLLVVTYHAVNLTAGAVPPWPNGATGVDLFFVISGFVMVVSSRRLLDGPHAWRSFLLGRIRRIVPLYWLMTWVKYGLCVAAPVITPHTRVTAWNMAASLLFVPTRDWVGIVRPVLQVGWTLNFEAIFYVLFAICLAARLHPLWMTPLLALLALAGFWRSPDWPAPFSLANGMVLEFAAGMAIACLSHGPRLRLPLRAAKYVLFAGFALLLLLPPPGPWRFIAWGLPAAAILAAALALERSVGPRLPTFVLAIGDASYAIYLVHPFVVPAFVSHGPLLAAASLPASIAAGLLVHRLIDAPLQRRLTVPRRPPPTYAEPEAGAGVLSL